MQPFDDGEFDARYDETVRPAIEAAGLEPYRVDHDPSVAVPIAEIESGIRNSRICLADISLDNANVWFELGYAIASNKDVILICGPSRSTKFPFDVQHRTIIRYKTFSPKDFARLSGEITSRLKARLAATESIQEVADIAQVDTTEGLNQAEIVVLAAIVQNLDASNDNVSGYNVRSDAENAGFTKVAANISLRTLLRKRFIEEGGYDDPYRNEEYTGYSLTEHGWAWIMENQEKFKLRRPDKVERLHKAVDFNDGDIPF